MLVSALYDMSRVQSNNNYNIIKERGHICLENEYSNFLFKIKENTMSLWLFVYNFITILIMITIYFQCCKRKKLIRAYEIQDSK